MFCPSTLPFYLHFFPPRSCSTWGVRIYSTSGVLSDFGVVKNRIWSHHTHRISSTRKEVPRFVGRTRVLSFFDFLIDPFPLRQNHHRCRRLWRIYSLLYQPDVLPTVKYRREVQRVLSEDTGLDCSLCMSFPFELLNQVRSVQPCNVSMVSFSLLIIHISWSYFTCFTKTGFILLEKYST